MTDTDNVRILRIVNLEGKIGELKVENEHLRNKLAAAEARAERAEADALLSEAQQAQNETTHRTRTYQNFWHTSEQTL